MFLGNRILYIFSVPAFGPVPFESLGNGQESREGMGLMNTEVAWPEACNVPGSLMPLGAVKGRIGPWLSVAKGSCSSGKITTTYYLLTSTFPEPLLRAENTAL